MITLVNKFELLLTQIAGPVMVDDMFYRWNQWYLSTPDVCAIIVVNEEGKAWSKPKVKCELPVSFEVHLDKISCHVSDKNSTELRNKLKVVYQIFF